MATRFQILWGIVFAVVVQMVNYQGTLLGASSRKPFDMLCTPVTGMDSGTDLLPQDEPMLGHGLEVGAWLKRMFLQPHEGVSSHAA